MSTCFQKRKSLLITFGLGETEIMIDFIFVNKYRQCATDVKEIVGQNCLLLMDMVFKNKVSTVGRLKFRKKLKLWNLRVEGERTVC